MYHASDDAGFRLPKRPGFLNRCLDFIGNGQRHGSHWQGSHWVGGVAQDLDGVVGKGAGFPVPVGSKALIGVELLHVRVWTHEIGQGGFARVAKKLVSPTASVGLKPTDAVSVRIGGIDNCGCLGFWH